jgi:hypothetical protein
MVAVAGLLERGEALLAALEAATPPPSLAALPPVDAPKPWHSSVSSGSPGGRPSVAALWIMCDADVAGVITRGGPEILDMGCAVRVATPAQRRALALRDRGCVVCRRPPRCDAHHKTGWVNGGATSLDHLVLVCRCHHPLIHTGAIQPE